MKTPKPKMPDGFRRKRRNSTPIRQREYAKRRTIRFANMGIVRVDLQEEEDYVRLVSRR